MPYHAISSSSCAGCPSYSMKSAASLSFTQGNPGKKHEIHGDLRRIDVIYDRNVGLNVIQVEFMVDISGYMI